MTPGLIVVFILSYFGLLLLIAWITGIIHCPVNYSIVHGSCNTSKNNDIPFPNINILEYRTLYDRLSQLSKTVDIETVTDQMVEEMFKIYSSKLPQELQTEEAKQMLMTKLSEKINIKPIKITGDGDDEQENSEIEDLEDVEIDDEYSEDNDDIEGVGIDDE